MACALLWAGEAVASSSPPESFIPEPMPPRFTVQATELDGPVFADERGRTLYTWPARARRNGRAGDRPGESTCGSTPVTVTAGLSSPYPADLELPDAATRPACMVIWPPAVAPDGATPVGKWTIVTRPDGVAQWAYDGYPVYASALDRGRGDAIGGAPPAPHYSGEEPVYRTSIGPAPDVPPGLAVRSTALGRQLVTERGASVYALEGEAAGRLRCDARCAREWVPVRAPAMARTRGPWSIVERSPGVGQWAFRGQPLYTHPTDRILRSLEGADYAGWRNVYVQRAPPPPGAFKVQDTIVGQVLADARGRTLYTYACGEDTVDQLACDHPSTTQAYRIAICGGGVAERCARLWPLVPAQPGERSGSRTWTILSLDPATGRIVDPARPGAMRVWAWRGRPVYTYAGDHAPGDIAGDGWGEFHGQRNGFRAMWLRDDFFAY